MEIRDLLFEIVCSIVDDVDNIVIDEEEDDKGYSFKVSLAPGDVGKLIGTKGRVASAIRTVLKAAGAKQGVRVMVNVDKQPLEL